MWVPSSPDETVVGQLQALRRDEWAMHARQHRQLRQIITGMFLLQQDVSCIGALVRQQTEILSGVARALENPRAAAAAELIRRGVRSMYNGWDDEAFADLSEAVSLDPYDPLVQLALGIAASRVGQTTATIEAWSASARYGRATSVGATATMLLLCSTDSSDQRQRAIDALVDYPSCAEVLLPAARVLDDTRLTDAAIAWDPAMAFAAVAAQIPGADQAVERLVTHTSGLTHVLARLHQAIAMVEPITKIPADLRSWRPPGGLWSSNPMEIVATTAYCLDNPTLLLLWRPMLKVFSWLAYVGRADREMTATLEQARSSDPNLRLYLDRRPAMQARAVCDGDHNLLARIAADFALVYQVQRRMRPLTAPANF